MKEKPIEIISKLHKINVPDEYGLKVSLQKAKYAFEKLKLRKLKEYLDKQTER